MNQHYTFIIYFINYYSLNILIIKNTHKYFDIFILYTNLFMVIIILFIYKYVLMFYDKIIFHLHKYACFKSIFCIKVYNKVIVILILYKIRTYNILLYVMFLHFNYHVIKIN